MTNFNEERSNPVKTMAPLRVYSNTHFVTQLRAYNEPLPFPGGTRVTIPPHLGVGMNRG